MPNGKTICTACNYIYDEAESKASFNSLSDRWVCPECGANKEMFQPCSCVQLADSQYIVETAVGELVAANPHYALIFKKYDIDYCCGGKLTLRQVCKTKNIDSKILIADLKASASLRQDTPESDWNKESLEKLIEHIITDYHVPLRKQLTFIEELARKVARVHARTHPEMVKLLDVLTGFKNQLELHMQKEEMVLFPAIIRLESGQGLKGFGCGGGIDHPITVMTEEHEQAGSALETMRKLTNNYAPPEDACTSFRLLLNSLESLESEMHCHVHKENNILFPRSLQLTNSTVACG